MRIAVVTGTRAEYGIWTPVLRALRARRGLELQLVVTGMHLLPEFGNTVRVIHKDGWEIAARVPMYERGHDADGSGAGAGSQDYAAALARGIAGMGKAFARLDPEVVMVLGDRLEILAAASAAVCQGRMLAHVHCGETAPGQFDEQIRHAVTKMAHLHFCATPAAAARIRQMGEDPKYIYRVGAPALDTLLQAAARWPRRKAAQPLRPVLVLHPSGADEATEYARTCLVIDALWASAAEDGSGRRRGLDASRILALGPNNDPGHRGILRAYRDRADQLDLRMNLSQVDFWRAAHDAGLLVGNSSSGIIEMASLGVAVVNVGDRQAGRERSGNVVDTGFEPRALRAALRRVLSDAPWRRRVAACRNIYGDGRAATRIVRVLADLADLRVRKSGVNRTRLRPQPKAFRDLPA
jgi:UDP-hydrolysing UDP-N-acetyl-D-glucosamine 2-epimerase